jgi:hypothetical protein
VDTYGRGVALADMINQAAGNPVAVCDPRSATPPCVLIVPPGGVLDGYCSATAEWNVFAIAPGPANADSWKELDTLLSYCQAALPVERWAYVAYSLSPDNPLMPAYRITFSQGVDL